jgi:hypothetical protein
MVSAETPLGGMDGGGVAETGRPVDVVSGESDGEVAAVVPDGEVTVPADVGDGPPVAVLDPVARGEAEPSVVGPGDDHISDTGLIAVAQPHHRIRHIPVEAVVSGATVEFGDQLAGRSEHDGVKPGRSVRKPSTEGILSGGGNVANMNPAMIKVELECLGLAVTEG